MTRTVFNFFTPSVTNCDIHICLKRNIFYLIIVHITFTHFAIIKLVPLFLVPGLTSERRAKASISTVK